MFWCWSSDLPHGSREKEWVADVTAGLSAVIARLFLNIACRKHLSKSELYITLVGWIAVLLSVGSQISSPMDSFLDGLRNVHGFVIPSHNYLHNFIPSTQALWDGDITQLVGYFTQHAQNPRFNSQYPINWVWRHMIVPSTWGRGRRIRSQVMLCYI